MDPPWGGWWSLSGLGVPSLTPMGLERGDEAPLRGQWLLEELQLQKPFTFLLGWPWEAQSSPRVARESWGLRSSLCRAEENSPRRVSGT